MTDAEKKLPVTPVPAATILLVRDAPEGLEVFMVKRHHQIDFISGALVFPGGKVDKRDNDAELADFTDGGDGWTEAMRALGAWVFGWLADTFGRRPILMINAPAAIGASGSRRPTFRAVARSPS